jgi:hypothetical protein
MPRIRDFADLLFKTEKKKIINASHVLHTRCSEHARQRDWVVQTSTLLAAICAQQKVLLSIHSNLCLTRSLKHDTAMVLVTLLLLLYNTGFSKEAHVTGTIAS